MKDFTPNDGEIITTRIVIPYYLYLMSNGIVFIRVSNEKPETVELAKEMVQQMGEMVNFISVPMLAWHETGIFPEKSNRDFWAKKDSCPYSIADAFIVPSLGMRVIANFYLRVSKPERPTRFFLDINEATVWLKSFETDDAMTKVNQHEKQS